MTRVFWAICLLVCFAACGTLVLSGCSGVLAMSPGEYAAHKRACLAKGKNHIAGLQAGHFACSYIEAQMRVYVDMDEDCKVSLKADDIVLCDVDGGTDAGR